MQNENINNAAGETETLLNEICMPPSRVFIENRFEATATAAAFCLPGDCNGNCQG